MNVYSTHPCSELRRPANEQVNVFSKPKPNEKFLAILVNDYNKKTLTGQHFVYR